MRRALVHGSSDIGRVRDRNEDSFIVGDLDAGETWDGAGELISEGPRGPLVIVCDGMGGAAGGEVASELAARTTWREMSDAQVTDDPQVFARLLRRAVRAANQRVHDEGLREPTLRGMGTTMSAAGLAGRYLVVAQVGDSRVYVQRAGVLTQVTRDQTLTQALVGAGRMTEAEADALVGGATILQALGVADDVEPSLSLVDLRQGDRVLVCSDGLYNQLGPTTIQAVLDGRKGPGALALALCDAARAAGGADNITAVVMFVEGDALPPLTSTDDLPRFVEFDPREEGERALTSTSYVARRLAARAGIGADPGPPVVPATGQHAIIPRGRLAPGATLADVAGPASRRLSGTRTKLLWLVLATAAASALGWWLAGG
ncbi:MAG TPA: protein phosphatase 2C domain-containing protein [Kofleriaceae bacterium]|nr:protein phosphatase 2C domain-containing protein [Kofleriaceae bacterium]